MRVALDTETHLIQAGLAAPPLVCGSVADELDAETLDVEGTRRAFDQYLATNCIVEGANFPFDLGVMLADNPVLTDAVFEKYERGEIRDVQINEALWAIEQGHLGKDPRTGGELKNPETGKNSKRYSLAICADLNGLSVTKGGTWRLKYALLDGKPMSEWPPEAVEYPRKDARVTYDVGTKQRERGGQNINNKALQAQVTRTAFCLALAGIRGFRTDPTRVAAVRARVEADWAKDLERWKRLGFLRDDGSECEAAVRRAVAVAYGATEPCQTCVGTGKVPSVKTGKPVQCKACSATGLHAPDAPRTDPSRTNPNGQISSSRDTLAESGDPDLEDYADVSNIAKLRDTYLPYLEQGTRVPITLIANPLLATQRVSYDGLIQLLPRKGGIRECFWARPGTVFCSADYSMLELVTLAQVLINLGLSTKMADAINGGMDLHTLLAAQILRVPYEELLRRVKAKDPVAVAFRQMAKAANFGFPGAMGPLKVVHTTRPQGVRWCELAGREKQCGRVKVREWGRDFKTGASRKCSPTCRTCIEVATEVRQAWFDLWQVKPYFDIVAREQKAGIPVVSFGTGLVRGGTQFNDRANHRFQNLAGQIATEALWDVTKECFTNRLSPLWGSRPLAFIHDEIFSEMPEERAHDAAYRKCDLMLAAANRFCPDVKASIEPAIARYWYKEMATVKDMSGRLIPWEPRVAA